MDIPPNKQVTEKDELILRFVKREGVLYPWRKMVIGLDGYMRAGKTTLASFLSWQLGMPFVPLDEFHIRGQDYPNLKVKELKVLIETRLGDDRPVIIEGFMLLTSLDQLGLSPDLYIWVDSPDGGGFPISNKDLLPSDVYPAYVEYRKRLLEITPDYVCKWREESPK
ncbi:MAG: hypothetical protein O3B43_05550 [Chloroflexi bacterium]|nr:hypothetical protein [Chloroflexota bacterium]